MLCALISSIRTVKFKPIIYCQFLLNNKVKGALFEALTLPLIITANRLRVFPYVSYHVSIKHTSIPVHMHTCRLTHAHPCTHAEFRWLSGSQLEAPWHPRVTQCLSKQVSSLVASAIRVFIHEFRDIFWRAT